MINTHPMSGKPGLAPFLHQTSRLNANHSGIRVDLGWSAPWSLKGALSRVYSLTSPRSDGIAKFDGPRIENGPLVPLWSRTDSHDAHLCTRGHTRSPR